MKKLSIVLSCFASLIFLTMNLFDSQQAEAAEAQTVYLHKQATKTDQTNQGMLTEKQGVNGAEFTVVDITHFVRTHSTSHEEALKRAKGVAKSEVAGLEVGQAVPNRLGMEVVAKGTTATMDVPNKQGQNEATDGVLKLALAKKNKSHDASYLFIETSSVSQAGPSDNIITHFPVSNELNDETSADVLHVYSKNDSLLEIPNKPDINKQLAEDHSDFTYGEAINYEIQVTVPTAIGNYQYFQVIDTPDAALLADIGSVKIIDQKGQPIAAANYQVKAKDNGFVVDFVPSGLAAYRDTKIKIFYQLKIKEGAAADTDFYNQAFLHYHDSLKEEQLKSSSKEVLTGGYRFVKVDKDNHQLKLKAAIFLVKNQAGFYLTKEYKWKKSDTPAKDEELLKLVSNQEGLFELKGLAYGDYQLEEIVAPEGYRLLEKTIDFKIEKNTYVAGETTGLLEVVNSKSTKNQLADTGNKQTTGGAGSMNQASGSLSRRLPSTGDRSLDVGLLGLLLMLIAFATYGIRKKQQQGNN